MRGIDHHNERLFSGVRPDRPVAADHSWRAIRKIASRFLLSAGLALQTLGSAAEAGAKQRGPAWQPSPGHRQIPIWPTGYVLAKPEIDGLESTVTGSEKAGGRSWTAILNVTVPTMTVYGPRHFNTGAAIMVLPGGGYRALAIDLEGEEICDWITLKGMSCILLKYRVPQDWHKDPHHEQAPAVQLALQDAQRAMGLVRQNAAALHIDPHRIGVIGFSAGGHLAAALSNAGQRIYAPVDAADRWPSRPDFAIVLYPGHLWTDDMPKDRVALARWNSIGPYAPPTFLLQSSADPVDNVRNAVFYALALSDAHVPVELHLYAGEAHAFGLRPGTDAISTAWPALVEKWLASIGVIGTAEGGRDHSARGSQ